MGLTRTREIFLNQNSGAPILALLGVSQLPQFLSIKTHTFSDLGKKMKYRGQGTKQINGFVQNKHPCSSPVLFNGLALSHCLKTLIAGEDISWTSFAISLHLRSMQQRSGVNFTNMFRCSFCNCKCSVDQLIFHQHIYAQLHTYYITLKIRPTFSS